MSSSTPTRFAPPTTSELFTQLQRLSSLQSLMKLLEDDQGPPPEEQQQHDGYLPVAKALLDSYEKSCMLVSFAQVDSSNAPVPLSVNESHHRALFSALFNIDDQPLVAALLDELEREQGDFASDSSNSSKRALLLSSIPSLLQQLSQLRQTNRERLADSDDDMLLEHEPLLPYDTEDKIFDLLAQKLGTAAAGSAPDSTSSATSIDVIMKKAMARGVLTMINRQAKEQVERELEAKDKRLALERKRADDFNRNLILKNIHGSGGSGADGRKNAGDGLGISIDDQDAEDDDEFYGGGTSDGTNSKNTGARGGGGGGERSRIRNQVEIERVDLEPRFLKSMGVSFRQRIDEASRKRHFEQLEISKMRAQAKRTGMSVQEIKTSKEKFLIERQQQRLNRDDIAPGGAPDIKNANSTAALTQQVHQKLLLEEQQQRHTERGNDAGTAATATAAAAATTVTTTAAAAAATASASKPPHPHYLTDLNSMQLALKKRMQLLREQKSAEARYLLSSSAAAGGGGGGGSGGAATAFGDNLSSSAIPKKKHHHSRNNPSANSTDLLTTDYHGIENSLRGDAAFTRDFGEVANNDDSGASLHLTLERFQNNSDSNNTNKQNSVPAGWMNKSNITNNFINNNNNNSNNNNTSQNARQQIGRDNISSNGPSRFEQIQLQRAFLPIAAFRDEIIQVIRSQRTNVISAETGSGKTTQLPRYLYDAGFCDSNSNSNSSSNNNNNNNNATSSTSANKDDDSNQQQQDSKKNPTSSSSSSSSSNKKKKKIIACTQPRLIAAKTVAARVAEEFGCQVGEQVGYTVRFDDCTSPLTVIKYMTDGVLLREALMDDSFSRYSVIVLDEAHERNLNTDILFALCKKAVLKNPDLTIVATSATLDIDKFCEYFGCEKKLEIPGRTFPVDRVWLQKPCDDYFEEAIETVMRIHITEKAGDILVFLTGKEEIETAKKRLERYMESEELRDKVPPLVITRLYAGLPDEDKVKALERTPPLARKVVLSTNIAETSVTIDGLFYVVDSGFHKQNVYNPATGVETLAVVPIARSQAKQRCGRAGRTGPGKCYFLYTEQQFWNDMVAASVPEIQRTNLANVVLTLKAIGFHNILALDFMDPPPIDALVNALEHLYFLSALDQDGVLTALGGRMSQLPVSPNESRALLTALELGCLDPVLTVVAMLGEQFIFVRPRERQEEADRARLSFAAAEGDHITLLRVWDACQDQRFSPSWMKINFINPNAISRCRELRSQLLNLLKKNLNRDRDVQNMLNKNYNISSQQQQHQQQQQEQQDYYHQGPRTFNTKYDLVKIRKSIIAGYFYHAARRSINKPTEYTSLTDKRTVYMNPNCVLFHSSPKFVVYHELLETTKEYMRECISVDPTWLLEMAPNFFSSPGAGQKTEEMRRQRIDPLLRSWESHGSGANTWRISKMRPPRKV